MRLPNFKMPGARPENHLNGDTLPQEHPIDPNHEKSEEVIVDTPIPLLTWRSFFMGIFVSMGGFLFGYDTGQISGFLEMENFLQRYGEQRSDGTYYFTNARSGLIVGLVRHSLYPH